MSRRTIYRIEDPGQLQALAVPARQRLVSALEALGTASVRQLAAHLGRSPESLYFHLRKLVACGLVEEAGERPAGRRTEGLFRLVASRLRIAGDLEQTAFRDALAETCRALCRATERDYCRSLEQGAARLHGAQRNLALHHYHVHLSPSDRRRLVQMFEELAAFVVEHNDPDQGELMSVTAALSPVTPPPAPPSRSP